MLPELATGAVGDTGLAIWGQQEEFWTGAGEDLASRGDETQMGTATVVTATGVGACKAQVSYNGANESDRVLTTKNTNMH